MQQGPPPAPTGDAERCLICLDDAFPPDAFLQSRAESGWGYAQCCGKPFHFGCLSKWVGQRAEVESSTGPVALATSCPGCRAAVPKTKGRMLGSWRQ